MYEELRELRSLVRTILKRPFAYDYSGRYRFLITDEAEMLRLYTLAGVVPTQKVLGEGYEKAKLDNLPEAKAKKVSSGDAAKRMSARLKARRTDAL